MQNIVRQIFKTGKKYTFSDYFKMSNPTEEIVTALGYSLFTQEITFPKHKDNPQQILKHISSTYYALIPKVSINSEAAKREIMIAPVLHTVIQLLNATLNIEYPVYINDKLNGTIDYLFRSAQELIVVEAKKGDLERGFNQLAAEMIAMDIYEEPAELAKVYGAVTIGEVWRFALLERESKRLIKDIHTFRFPEDIQDIVAILVGILND